MDRSQDQTIIDSHIGNASMLRNSKDALRKPATTMLKLFIRLHDYLASLKAGGELAAGHTNAKCATFYSSKYMYSLLTYLAISRIQRRFQVATSMCGLDIQKIGMDVLRGRNLVDDGAELWSESLLQRLQIESNAHPLSWADSSGAKRLSTHGS